MRESFEARPTDKSEVIACLDDFMSSDDRKTLALKGRWGCGKTHFWNEYISNSKAIREKRIAYVSLFDVSSIQEVKSKIVMASLTKDLRGWKAHTKSVCRAIRENIGRLPYLGGFLKSDATLAAIEDLYLKKFLICIDDIERRSPKLEMGQILGLVSVLREHRKCRIVLILNEEQIEGGDKKALDSYRDKVIDMELRFHPTVSDNAKFVIAGHELEQELLELFEKLCENNIRVMQKTTWRLERLFKIIPSDRPEARREMGLQLAILACLHYSENCHEDINRIRGVQSWHNMISVMDPDNKDAILAETLTALGWGYPKHEGLLIDAVLDEYFDEELIREAADQVQASYRNSALQREIETVFGKFRSNFQSDLNEVKNDLWTVLNKYGTEMDWNQLGQVLSLLTDLGDNPSVTVHRRDWLKAHPEAHKDEEMLEHLLSSVEDTVLRGELEEKARAATKKMDLVQCMSSVAYGQSWGGHEDRALKSATEDDFLELLSTSKEAELIPLVRKFLTIVTSFGRKEQDWADLAGRIQSALLKVAKQSPLNRIRVEKFFGTQVQLPIEETLQDNVEGE